MTREMIIQALERKGYRTAAKDVVKNGVTLEGILFFPEEKICPIYYVDDFRNTNMSVEEVADTMIAFLKDNYDHYNQLRDKDSVFEHLYITIQHSSDQNFVKKETRFKGIESVLALKYENGIMKLRPGFLEAVNVSEEDAWKIAEENVCKDTVCKKLTDLVSEMGDFTMESDDNANISPDDIPIYILTNKSGAYGASAILNTEAVKNICKKMNTKAVYMLPSSIHEVILIPQREGTITQLSNMVKEVNKNIVNEKEQLADRAFLLRF